MIQFDETVCGDLTQSSRLEWLETNGLGGFASSTVPGLNTRRYHGLLTAATKPPVGRMVLLSKMEDRLIVSGEAHDLSANQYPGVIHPQGYACLKQFRLDPFPTSVYAADSVEIEKRIFMVDGQNTTVIEYEALHGSAVLELRPLIGVLPARLRKAVRFRISFWSGGGGRRFGRSEGGVRSRIY